ncbi:MAG: hypothetical protein SFZ02_00735 [bacterium]|nr:hypothetical protein [bacterium]
MMIKHNFQILFILRLIGVISLITGILCVLVVGIGNILPTTMIVAETRLPEVDTYLVLFDVHRNLSIYFSLPVQNAGEIIPSPNKRRFITITYDIDEIRSFVAWDIFTGYMIYLEDIFSECNIIAPNWSPDNRYITFSCESEQQGIFMEKVYMLDFETSELSLLSSSEGLYIAYARWSPDLRHIILETSNNKLTIVKIDSLEEQIITPNDEKQNFLSWIDNGASILIYDSKAIKKYTFATNSWSVLLDDFSFQKSPVLSPNGEWIAIISNWSAYIFHIPTYELVMLSSLEYEINLVEDIFWSPDNQWLLIRCDGDYSPNSNIYYLVKLDTSVVTVLGEYIQLFPTWVFDIQLWSSNSEWISYNIYSANKRYIVKQNELTGLYEPYHIINGDIQQAEWSPNNDGLAFIYQGAIRQLAYWTPSNEIRLLNHPTETVIKFGFVK